jgi:SIR2-like domain
MTAFARVGGGNDLMNNLLLLGAGFSRNWNGRLASEVRSDLQTRLQGDAYVSRLLQRHDFETVLAMVQAEFVQKQNAEGEARLRATQTAINDVFSRMNLAFQRRMTMEFGNDAAFRIQPYLARFDAIFSINQDMLLELHYHRNDPSVWDGTMWNGYVILGMTERAQSSPYPYDVLQSKWNPTGDFQLVVGQQPFIKLHGSSNWETGQGEPMLVMGKAKLAQINQHPVLKRYFEYFVECLSKPDTRLTVIGYGFADEHINEALLEAGRRGTMKMFVVHPRGREVLVRQRNAQIPPPEPLRDDIPSLGDSVWPLSRTFLDDELERDALYAVLK